MNKDYIISFLRENKPFLRDHFGVKSIALFGSQAKGNQKGGSDIDLLVELTEPRFQYLMGCILYLEEKLGGKVDVIRKGPHLRKQFLDSIEKDLIYA